MFRVLLIAIALLSTAGQTNAQSVKIGELNSYKAMPAFLEPYRKGWQLALEEVNSTGGLLGQRLEVVSRDDMGDPGRAVRVAEELVSRERVNVLFGTFFSHVGLAVANLAQRRNIVFLAAEPLTDKIVWESGNRYTFRLRPSTYMQVAMLIPDATRLKKKRWAIVFPNYEYGQSATESFKKLLLRAQPGTEFVTELAVPLGKIEAGSIVQALIESKAEAIFSSLFSSDLHKFVREANLRGLAKDRPVFNLLAGEPEFLDPMKEETPDGWYVTGYPWRDINTAVHRRFITLYQRRWQEDPRLGSVVGYVALHSIAKAIRKARSVDAERLISTLRGLEVSTPFGPITYRAIDHQATMGAYVGQLAKRDGKGTMVKWRFADGADFLPPPHEIQTLRRVRK